MIWVPGHPLLPPNLEMTFQEPLGYTVRRAQQSEVKYDVNDNEIPPPEGHRWWRTRHSETNTVKVT